MPWKSLSTQNDLGLRVPSVNFTFYRRKTFLKWSLGWVSRDAPRSRSNGLVEIPVARTGFPPFATYPDLLKTQLCVSFKCTSYEWTLWGLSAGCTLIFAIEMAVKMYAYGPIRYWTDPLDCIDGLCVIGAVLGIDHCLRRLPVLEGLAGWATEGKEGSLGYIFAFL